MQGLRAESVGAKNNPRGNYILFYFIFLSLKEISPFYFLKDVEDVEDV